MSQFPSLNQLFLNALIGCAVALVLALGCAPEVKESAGGGAESGGFSSVVLNTAINTSPGFSPDEKARMTKQAERLNQGVRDRKITTAEADAADARLLVADHPNHDGHDGQDHDHFDGHRENADNGTHGAVENVTEDELIHEYMAGLGDASSCAEGGDSFGFLSLSVAKWEFGGVIATER